MSDVIEQQAMLYVKCPYRCGNETIGTGYTWKLARRDLRIQGWDEQIQNSKKVWVCPACLPADIAKRLTSREMSLHA